MPNLPQLIDDTKAKWTVAGTVKKRWFVFVGGLLLGALLTACCNKYGCRHLMYFSCLFLFLGALIGFFIAVIFSIIVLLTHGLTQNIDKLSLLTGRPQPYGTVMVEHQGDIAFGRACTGDVHAGHAHTARVG